MSQTNLIGTTASFVVSATGIAPLHYQWHKDASDLTDRGNIVGSGTNKLVLSNLTAADSGTYSVTITNSSGTTNSTEAVLTVYTLLVQNGGFEMGEFTGWSLSGNAGGTAVTTANDLYVHSGNYGVQIGPATNVGYLSQTVPTEIGQFYLLSLWLDSPNGQTPNEFMVAWGGQTILDQADVPASGWTNMQLVVAGTGTNTLLQFGFRNDPSYFGFDDISLQPLRGLLAIAEVGTNICLTWNALTGVTYQVQYKGNLTQSSWTNLGDAYIPQTNGTATNLDPFVTGRVQRYYRLNILP